MFSNRSPARGSPYDSYNRDSKRNDLSSRFNFFTSPLGSKGRPPGGQRGPPLSLYARSLGLGGRGTHYASAESLVSTYSTKDRDVRTDEPKDSVSVNDVRTDESKDSDVRTDEPLKKPEEEQTTSDNDFDNTVTSAQNESPSGRGIDEKSDCSKNSTKTCPQSSKCPEASRSPETYLVTPEMENIQNCGEKNKESNVDCEKETINLNQNLTKAQTDNQEKLRGSPTESMTEFKSRRSINLRKEKSKDPNSEAPKPQVEEDQKVVDGDTEIEAETWDDIDPTARHPPIPNPPSKKKSPSTQDSKRSYPNADRPYPTAGSYIPAHFCNFLFAISENKENEANLKLKKREFVGIPVKSPHQVSSKTYENHRKFVYGIVIDVIVLKELRLLKPSTSQIANRYVKLDVGANRKTKTLNLIDIYKIKTGEEEEEQESEEEQETPVVNDHRTQTATAPQTAPTNDLPTWQQTTTTTTTTAPTNDPPTLQQTTTTTARPTNDLPTWQQTTTTTTAPTNDLPTWQQTTTTAPTNDLPTWQQTKTTTTNHFINADMRTQEKKPEVKEDVLLEEVREEEEEEEQTDFYTPPGSSGLSTSTSATGTGGSSRAEWEENKSPEQERLDRKELEETARQKLEEERLKRKEQKEAEWRAKYGFDKDDPILKKKEKERQEKQERKKNFWKRCAGNGGNPFHENNEPAADGDGGDLDEVKENIADALDDAWLMDVADRKKVVKRLLLEWHPDKNPDKSEESKIIFQHLQKEIKRCEGGIPRIKLTKWRNFMFGKAKGPTPTEPFKGPTSTAPFKEPVAPSR